MSNKANPTSQVISLPKGGGAIHGIGESFAADLHTGTGNFTIPIAVPPGRNGLQPQLSLAYSTGTGNGAFGQGWSLGIPGVSRKTSRGIPRYRDDDAPGAASDTFLLCGAEDLVAVAFMAGTTRYRPRTEGLFARIEHRRDAATDHWEVRSKDGLVSIYGSPGRRGGDPAVVSNPENAAEIFSWSLTETRDPFGNLIRYEYERDRGNTAEHLWDQLYIRRIRYADYPDPAAGGDTAFLISVTFAYEDRPDPFSDYRAGFEIRTTRRCTRINVATHADRERAARTYHLIYLDRRGLPIEQLPPTSISLLSQVTVEGHDEERHETLPPLQFAYTSFEPARQRYQPFEGTVPSRSLAHPEYELVDLYGTGLPAVLEIDERVRYWRNRGHGRFDRVRTMDMAPAGVRLSEPGVQLLDAEGNGRADLMVSDGVRSGFYPLSFDGTWNERGFMRYPQVPNLDLDAADLRLVDLDGDGVTDALRTGPHFELYFNDPEDGWSAAKLRERVDSDTFPNITFEDPRVKLADLTGDGLQDVVLIHNGRVEYWPYRGYGRWGRRVTMRNAPRFEDHAYYPGTGYDPRRLFIGDVDGDGVADLLYISSGRLTLWINQCGNAWSDPIVIHGTPPVTDTTAVRLADMLGTGTDGVLWTYDFGAFPDSTYKFLDLTGGIKPYVLHQMDNQMGAVTRVSYAPSTKFYLEDDERPATRWRTALPFPVQVVARVEAIDQISGGKLTTEYRYRHGYWDGAEREFRGFGMVEQLDTETFADYHRARGPSAGTVFEPVDAVHFSPPLLTKTWFHSGPVDDDSGDWRELDLSQEYWHSDPPALGHAGGVNAFLDSLSQPRHKRDALRTLRGSVLRTELYALDRSARQDRPYTVTEQAFGVREESVPPSGDTRRRIFFPYRVAQRTTQWESGDEPMTQLEFVDDYDGYGQARRQVSVAVPRHRDYRSAAPASAPYLATMTILEFAQRDDPEGLIVDRASRTTTLEVRNDGSTSVFDLYRAVQDNTASTSVIGQTINYYDGDPFVGLPFGWVGDFGALVRSESLMLTEELLREFYRNPAQPDGPQIPPYLAPEGAVEWTAEYPQAFRDHTGPLARYHFADGTDHRIRGYFAHSSRIAFDFQIPGTAHPRGLAIESRDPLGHDTTTTYDAPYRLLPSAVTDAAGLTIAANYDYRVLAPRVVTDANGNRRAVAFSPLGMVTRLAVMGKNGEPVGDTPDAPGTRLEYDFFAFARRREPVFVRSIVRQHHVTDMDVPLPRRDETMTTIEYSDGFARMLQTRTQSDDVVFGNPVFGQELLPLDQSVAGGDAAGRRAEAHPSVVVSGWQVYDNKGRVVRQYEPFFGSGWEYRAPADAERGRSAATFYDPRGQVIRTLSPDGSEQRVIHGVPRELTMPDEFEPTPWEAYTYDANDLASLSTAPDGSSLAAGAPAAHAFTPSSIVIDALGRTIETVARNREPPEQTSDPMSPIQEIRTQSAYDIRGNLLAVTDALGRVAFRYSYDLANRPWRTESIDAGLCRLALDGLGREIERRDGKGALTLHSYDRLQRPVRLWARDDEDGQVSLRQRLEYGDGGTPDQPAPERAAMRAHNLLGQLSRHYDEAGVVSVMAVDFKGTVLERSRRVIADARMLAAFDAAPANGWRVTPFQVDWEPGPGQPLDALEQSLVEETAYETTTRVDALGRVTRLQLPQDVEGRRRELRAEYTRRGGLNRVWLDDTLYLDRIAYDAKGQRALIAYANGVMTRYAYDLFTFRLKRLRSERYTKPDDLTYRPDGDVLQDYGYDYDLAGNIVSIGDRTPGSGILNNPEAATAGDPVLAQLLASGNALNRRFTYDAIYRLLSATGRECDRPPDAPPWDDQLRCTDLTRTRTYTERYAYDAAGNLLQLAHRSSPTEGFVRRFSIDSTQNNRLTSLTVGETPFAYTFDASGNMRSEATSRWFEWNHADQMKAFRTQVDGAEPSTHAQYLYDAAGQRVKKLVRTQGRGVEVTHYVDRVFEHSRWHALGDGENNHLHMMDDLQRIALVRVGPAQESNSTPAVQFQLADHLGSSTAVINPHGDLLNREEYTPYGETSFGSFSKKRYRFAGMERDSESGANYHGARHYLPWTSRWMSCDPLQLTTGINLYVYCYDSPTRYQDPSGLQATSDDQQLIDLANASPIVMEGQALHQYDQLFQAERNQLTELVSPEAFEKRLRSQHSENGDPYARTWPLEERLAYWEATDLAREGQAFSKWGSYVSDEYMKYLDQKAAEWAKATRLMSSVLPFVGLAFFGSAVAAAGAWSAPCLVVAGEAAAVGTTEAALMASVTYAGSYLTWSSEERGGTAGFAGVTTTTKDAFYVYRLVDMAGDTVYYGKTNSPIDTVVRHTTKPPGPWESMEVFAGPFSEPEALAYEQLNIQEARRSGKFIYNQELEPFTNSRYGTASKRPAHYGAEDFSFKNGRGFKPSILRRR